ncbi:trypco2 family protein [Streptomyces macrosporus]|uniref:Trypsin-co-occurring domain-containing protein n=1 Tax=Streptomyces macrosporus TaxID=44032 RepID=A0ABN3KAS5_9ACTN
MTDARDTSDDSEIGLVDVIRQVRADLAAAQREGDGRGGELRFAVDRVCLEVAIQVRKEGTGRTGLRIGVVTADLGGKAGKDTTHRIQVELVPRHRGGTLHVGGEPCD